MTKYTLDRRLWLGLGFVLFPALQAPAAEPRVALVVEATGRALVAEGASVRPLQLLEWLPAGRRLETHADGSLRIVFRDGRRYELRGEAKAVVRRDGLRTGRGVRVLPALPALPDELFAPVRPSDPPGAAAAVVRVRAPSLRTLAPAPDGWVLAEEELKLAFETPRGMSSYHVEVQAPDGRVVFETKVSEGKAAVPATALRPGTTYFWRVRGSRSAGGAAEGSSSFRTWPENAVQTRHALRALAEAAPDGDAAMVLAAIEDELGHAPEARRLSERAVQARLASSSIAPERQSP